METVEQPTPVAAPVVEQVESGSLSDHEATYAPSAKGSRRAPEPSDVAVEDTHETPAAKAERERGARSGKQAAGADDVPRIKELTRKWREEERQRTALQAELDQLRSARPAASGSPASGTPGASSPPAAPAVAGRPKLEDFAHEDDPYGAHKVAEAVWLVEQKWQARQDAEAAERQNAETERSSNERIASFGERVQDFIGTHPDYIERVEAIRNEKPPDLLLAALIDDDNGPNLLYHLAQNDALRLELHLATEDKPVTPTNVATVRRLLNARIAAATTGSAQPVQIPKPAPRPPNPVRTGPQKTSDELPADDDMSLSRHERAFGPKRR